MDIVLAKTIVACAMCLALAVGVSKTKDSQLCFFGLIVIAIGWCVVQ